MTVYLMLSHSGTMPANVVRLFTRKEYSHVCYSPTADLQKLYTFGRRYTKFFIPGGFIDGGIDGDFYTVYPQTKIRLYAVEITPQQKELIDARLAPFAAQPLCYKYGFANCVYQFFGLVRHRAHHYTCSQFVATLFDGILPFPHDISLMRPVDFDALGLSCIFTGTAQEYRAKLAQQEKEGHHDN